MKLYSFLPALVLLATAFPVGAMASQAHLPPLPPEGLTVEGGALIGGKYKGHDVTILIEGSISGKATIGAPEVLTYKDDAGRIVHVFADIPVPRDEAEKIIRHPHGE